MPLQGQFEGDGDVADQQIVSPEIAPRLVPIPLAAERQVPHAHAQLVGHPLEAQRPRGVGGLLRRRAGQRQQVPRRGQKPQTAADDLAAASGKQGLLPRVQVAELEEVFKQLGVPGASCTSLRGHPDDPLVELKATTASPTASTTKTGPGRFVDTQPTNRPVSSHFFPQPLPVGQRLTATDPSGRLAELMMLVVDVGGFEPPTFDLSGRCTNQLCYTSVLAHNDWLFVLTGSVKS